MQLTQCSKGHFYDADRYHSCPFCGGGDDENVTVAFSSSENQAQAPDKTVSLDQIQPEEKVSDLDEKTISIFNMSAVDGTEKQQTPVVGWLVCVKGKFYGDSFRLKSGKNFIGRNEDMDVCLKGEQTVSRSRHAEILYEPKKNVFIAQPGESRELFYVNEEVVLSPAVLKKNDIIQVGDAELMLIPCCDDAFTWNRA